MDDILKIYKRGEIASICKVSYRTVLNWIKLKTIPLWAIKKLGFDIKNEPTPMSKRL